jgi:hypothetical protein
MDAKQYLEEKLAYKRQRVAVWSKEADDMENGRVPMDSAELESMYSVQSRLNVEIRFLEAMLQELA